MDETTTDAPLIGHDFGRTPMGHDQVRVAADRRRLLEGISLRDALRALQALDRREELDLVERSRLLEAEDAIGALLGLACTGDATSVDGDLLWYAHVGETCPVHESLDP